MSDTNGNGQVYEAVVAILVPSGDEWKTPFGFSLARLMQYTQRHAPQIRMNLYSAVGSLLPGLRQNLVDAALENDQTTHCLFFDSDMQFPPDTLLRLLGRDVTAICASYTQRTPPFEPVAFADAVFTQRIWPTEDQPELQAISACGMGCMMVKADVFRQMPRPHFPLGWDKATGHWVGEDVYFCVKLCQMGIPLVLDSKLTQEIRHTGTYFYGPEDAIAAATGRGMVIPGPAPVPFEMHPGTITETQEPVIERTLKVVE